MKVFEEIIQMAKENNNAMLLCKKRYIAWKFKKLIDEWK